ncbi:MAG: AMIN domain-containing protein, partial [Comamonadaceae bacterium]
MKAQARMTWKGWLRGMGFGLFALGASVLAQAQNAIQAVTGSVQSGAEVVRIDFEQPLMAVPQGFTVQNPARIALDFPGVVNAIGRSAIEMNQGNIRSANVVQAGDRTRLVLNLKQAAAYRAEVQGKSLLVVLDPVAGPAIAAGGQAAFAENRNRDTLPIRDIDFRLGDGNTGRVIVDLPNNQVGVDVRQQ